MAVVAFAILVLSATCTIHCSLLSGVVQRLRGDNNDNDNNAEKEWTHHGLSLISGVHQMVDWSASQTQTKSHIAEARKGGAKVSWETRGRDVPNVHSTGPHDSDRASTSAVHLVRTVTSSLE